ncbi:MAG: hypothetical protein PVS2B3_13330 [Steroidobacteraceae bacterium]
MFTRHAASIAGLLGFTLVVAVCMPSRAVADADDPPTRVARLADAEGSVSFQPGGTQDWIAAPLNRPLTTGDKLWADRDGRVELQLDGSFLRLSGNTAVSFLNLSDEVTQVQLSAGTLLVRVHRLADNETYEIDTPNLAFSILRPGLYRLSVDESGNTTAVRVRSGQGEVTGGGAAYTVRAGESDVFSGTDQLTEYAQAGGPDDAFDAWSASRDGRWDHSTSARYVSPDVIGYQDLDNHGTWSQTPEDGYVWFPRQVEAGWAPYHYGHWAFIAPWGYTWVDDAPWGFAPFHYGRWISYNGAWGWVPCPRRPEGEEYVRPVYAPALVAWIGVGAGVAWFALGPREVYVPSYPVSRGYVRNINVSNTTVNTTVINNVYNTTVINNNTVNVTNVTYVNRGVPGAVAATTSQAFASAQPVSRNTVRVDSRALAAAQVRALAPAAVPTKQAVLGARGAGASQPPAAVQTRTVVARKAPPPPPPAFEQRQAAIASNAGKPLSMAQTRQIQTSVAPRAAAVAVRIAPPALPHATAQPAVKANVPAGEAPSRTERPPPPAVAEPPPHTERPPPPAVAEPPPHADRPPAGPPPRPPVVASNPVVSPAVHPSELPAAPKPPSPNIANSALEREHLQQQQQLRAAQEQQRQQVQQQQELEHQRLARQQADEAQRQRLQQQLEQQHQQQTQALQQQHAQQEQQLQQRQQEQRRQAEAQSKPASKPAERPAEKPAQPANRQDRPPEHTR